MTLSQAMAPLGRNQRWINWTLEPDPKRPEKPRKVPRSPLTGGMVGATDQSAWSTYEVAHAAAVARGYGLGYVFHEGDGLFFIDLDNCWDADTGQWNPVAQGLIDMWKGHAAVEVSQSGKGLHIIGHASSIPPHGCKNVILGLELYHTDRFMAFTDRQSFGSIDADMSQILDAVIRVYFPKPTSNRDVVDWCDEGDGAEADDTKLLDIMLRSGLHTAAAAFKDNHVPFKSLWHAEAEVLAKAFPCQNGYDPFDRSHADSALACHLVYWCGGNFERVRAFMLRSALVRDKWEDRPDYLETTILKAASVVKNRATPRQRVQRMPDTERRDRQRELNRAIGEGSQTVPTAQILTLEEMLKRYVFIKGGSQVADLLRPQVVLPWPEFKNAMAGSAHAVPKEDGSSKMVPCAPLWLKHPDRMDAETLTFRAGADLMTVAPEHGTSALNLWSPPARDEAPHDWRARADLFVGHIQWLWGEHANAFLDWLAHIEQDPGKLPHFGWVHIARWHGTGRNWVSSVLARLWRGNVAASFDLIGALEGKFNGQLSRTLLAIVDEINEGGTNSWRHAQSLRQMVTAETRQINPKYGRQHVEYNSTRWLLFSNHTAAIPLGPEDRRFYVVNHDGPPRAPNYYTALYAAVDDPLFILSVAKFLAERDISDFNPGMRPPVTDAKTALVALSQSENDVALSEIVQRWPVDVIAWNELGEQCSQNGEFSFPALKHALERAGIKRIGKVRTASGPQPVYSVRDYARWRSASHHQIKEEISRVSTHMKIAALYGE